MLFFDASLSLCSQKKMNDESVPGQKKLLIGPSAHAAAAVSWMARCRKKVNCILGLDKPIIWNLICIRPRRDQTKTNEALISFASCFLKQYNGYLVVSILVLSRGPTLFSHLPTPMVEVRQGGYIQNSAKIWK